MKRLLFYILTCSALLSYYSCKKYKDPEPQNLGLTNLYCNNPFAVNYNWGFPGVPNDSVCFFPSDVFEGSYKVYDSLLDENGLSTFYDSFNISVFRKDDSLVHLVGFCSNNDSLHAKCGKNLRLTLDTTAGIVKGQLACSTQDTINGFAIKKSHSDTTFEFNYNLFSSTKTLHKASFKQQ